jgi:hypothetical protein
MLRRLHPLRAVPLLLAAACYEYVPAPNPAALVGQRVQLALTDSGTVALASQLGPSTESVEGTLLADSAGKYLIGMAVSRTRGGTEMDWRGERVAVAHALVASTTRRQFSPSRSVFAGGLAAAGLTGITVGLRGRGQSGGSPGGGRPIPQ